MKPQVEVFAADSAHQHRRGVRLFVGVHLAAVAAIYVIAVIVGGGFASPPLPTLTVAKANTSAARATSVRTDTQRSALPAATKPIPDWAGRAELAAPWEQR